MKIDNTFNNARLIIFVIVSISVFVACSSGSIKMYSGDVPKKEKLAFLDSSGTLKTIMSKSAAVVVKSVNDNPTHMKKSVTHARIELLPGKHVLKVELLRSINTEYSDTYGSTSKEFKVNKEISFQAEAGHYYQIYGLLDPDQTFPWFTWIEDKTGGRVVAGEKPK